jgi:uncharacterized alkaline shock family protein YloU
VEGSASISTDILARYAGDAAREVAGVLGLHGRRGARIDQEAGRVRVELHLVVAWHAAIPAVGRAVQERVRGYLASMAGIESAAVEVVVDEIGPVS